MAIDPRDQDALKILPGELHDAVLEAMKDLGFRLTEAPLAPSRKNQATGCMKEFEFKPSPGSRFTHLDEAEIAFLPSSQGVLDVLIQRDTKARGLGSLVSEMGGADEQFFRMTLMGGEQKDQVQRTLADVLS